MTYFITEIERQERKSTCYFEFQKGRFKNKFWETDSLCLHGTLFDRHLPYELICKALPHFAYYGVTEVTFTQYLQLKESALAAGGETAAVIRELDTWASECYQSEKVFTILGL